MTPDQISKLPPELRKAAELCEKATAGPWADVTETPYLDIIHGEHGAQVISIHQGIHREEDAQFITESRTALPLALAWCLQVVEERDAAIKEARILRQAYEGE